MSRRRSAFTLIELMVAITIGVLVMAVAMAFMYFAGLSVSGITSQSVINRQAGNAIEFIQGRARLATSISVNVKPRRGRDERNINTFPLSIWRLAGEQH